ncbi:hypothetical protein BofuT4_uP035580.1 [Botrytis cinerea T4]|uniref:Uncharacterized protein n=1 Tax=Botryotinia fuckeliana (strain T4) TaxID=999810 RepID=G2Y4I8_BOTF4|nr:hypothetical protein BofuT4_uP035580.1 [Botrytis cinerea T4]
MPLLYAKPSLLNSVLLRLRLLLSYLHMEVKKCWDFFRQRVTLSYSNGPLVYFGFFVNMEYAVSRLHLATG